MKYLLAFLLPLFFSNVGKTQEAIRIFDVKKKTVTYSLNDLNNLDRINKKESIEDFKKNEEEVTSWGPVYAVDFTVDGHFILSAGTDGFVQLWNVVTGKKIKRIKCHQGKVLAAKFFMGNKFFSTSDDGSIKLFSGSNGHLIKEFVTDENIVNSVSFSAIENLYTDGLGSGTDYGNNIDNSNSEVFLKRQDITKKSVVGMEQSRVYNMCLNFSDNKKYLAVGSSDALITVYDIDVGTSIKFLRGHKGKINCIAFIKSKKDLVSGSDDNNLIVWHLDRDKCSFLKGHKGPVLSIAASNNAKTIASGGADGIIRIWDLAKNKCTKTLEGHESSVTSIAFTRDGKYLISGSLDYSIRIWDVKKSRLIKVFSMNNYPINSIAVSHNGHFIISGASTIGSAIRLYNLGLVIKDYEQHKENY